MGLTGVPRSFSIALMGLSEVTGGNQSQGVFFSAGYKLGIMYMELSSFLFCKIMDYVNLFVCKSRFLSFGIVLFFCKI